MKSIFVSFGIKEKKTVKSLKNVFCCLHKDAGNYNGSCHAATPTFGKRLLIDRLIGPPK